MTTKSIQIKLAKRYVIMKSLGWISALIGLLLIVGYTEIEQHLFARQLNLLNDLAIEEMLFLGGIGVILLGVMIHSAVFRHHCKLRVAGHSIEIARGIFLRHHVMVPLTKVTRVTLGRDLRHFLVGLFYLELSSNAPLQDNSSSYSIRIEGLRRKDAMLIRNTVERFLRRQNEGNSNKAEMESRKRYGDDNISRMLASKEPFKSYRSLDVW